MKRYLRLLNLERLLLLEDEGVVELSADIVAVVNHGLEFRYYFLLCLLEQNSINKSPAFTAVL